MLTEGSKAIYQPWSQEEFMADRRVRRMSPTAAKTYMMLLHEAYICSTRPYLPDDEDELFLMAYCESQEEWDSVKGVVLGMFEKGVIDGVPVLINKRLERDWAHLQEIREVRSQAGKKGGLAKASKSQAKVAVANQNVASKEVSKEVSEEKKENEESFEDGESDMSKISKEIQLACGGRAKVYPQQDEQLKALEVEHSRSAVVTDFKAFLQENDGDDFRYGPVSAYLHVASDRLSADTAPAVASARDPEVISLARELTYASGGDVAFQDKQRSRLAEVLKEFPAELVKETFVAWLGNQDMSDPKNVSFLAGKFVQIADSLCYAAERKRIEADQTRALREQTAARLQAEAEQERLAKAQQEKLVEDFDPLED